MAKYIRLRTGAVGRALLTLALLALSGLVLSSSPVFAGQPTRVTLARLAPSSLLWLHAIATDQGMYTKRGLEVVDVQVQSSAALVQAVASGSADAGIALGDNVMQAIDQGAPVVITGAILHKPVLRLIGNVDSIPELRGKRVTAGAVEGGTTDLMYYMFQKAGLDWRQTQIVALTNSSDRVVALQRGELHGALLIPPFDTIALRSGSRLLDVYNDYWVQTPLIVNTNWAARNRDAAKKLTQALAEAAAWIYNPNNRQKAIEILAAYTNVSYDIAEEGYRFMVEEIQAISPDLTVPAEGLESIVRIREAVHLESLLRNRQATQSGQGFNLYKYYDPSYLQD